MSDDAKTRKKDQPKAPGPEADTPETGRADESAGGEGTPLLSEGEMPQAVGEPPGAEKPGEKAGEKPARTREDEIAELKDQLLRAVAETENVRRRAERERQDVARYAISDFARDILAVADNLRRALDAVPESARGKDEFLDNLAAGVEATERELLSALEKYGIRRIEALGRKFDHDYHEAMFEVENTGQPPGTVVELLQPGYVIHDRLLRPARVGVAKGDPAKKHVDTTA